MKLSNWCEKSWIAIILGVLQGTQVQIATKCYDFHTVSQSKFQEGTPMPFPNPAVTACLACKPHSKHGFLYHILVFDCKDYAGVLGSSIDVDLWPCIWKLLLAYLYLYHWRLAIVEVTWVINDNNFFHISRYDSHLHYIFVVMKKLLFLYIIRNRKSTASDLIDRFHFLSNLVARIVIHASHVLCPPD